MMNLIKKSLKYKIASSKLPLQEIEESAHELLIVVSEKLKIDRQWTLNHHYSAERRGGLTTFVFQAKHPKLPYSVAIKCLHQQGVELSSRVRAEHARLTDLYDRLTPDSRSIVTRPIALTSHGYAYEWVDLRKMETVLLANSFSKTRRQKCVEAAGASLRLMHDAMNSRWEPLNVAEMIKRLEATGGSGNAWNTAVNRIIQLSGEFDGQLVQHGLIHADYTPGNILFGKDRCVIFDFGRQDRFEPLYADVVLFLMYVGAYSNFGSKNMMQRQIKNDMDTFMNAYGDKGEHDLKTICFMYLALAVKRWGRHESKSNDPNRKLYLRSYDKIAVRRFEWFYEQISGHFQHYDKPGQM